MPRNERNQNGRSTVRVLHFPASSPAPVSTGLDSDALADSIRKAWTQKAAAAKNPSGTRQNLLRLADENI
jgi:hypothetical protein